jgi:hypothetical protein
MCKGVGEEAVGREMGIWWPKERRGPKKNFKGEAARG